MALQVWLPLLSDLHNQGLSTQTSNITTTPTWATMGKLGSKSLYTKTRQTTMHFPGLVGVSTYSVAYWLYIPTATAPTAWSDMFGIAFNCAGTTVWERDERRAATTTGRHNYHLAKSASEGSNTNTYYGIREDDSANDNWVHYVLTKDDSGAKLYANGTLVATVPAANFESTKRTMTGNVYLGDSGCEAYLNDFRIYDHCLSPMEVKEISKGLVLHYPLSSQFETGQTNKYSSPYSDGYCSSSSWTRTQLTNERGWNYKLTKTGDGNNSWPNCAVPTYSFTSGKTYYYSVKVRCNKWTNGTLTLRASRSSNDWVTRGVTVCSSSLADGKWHEYYTYQTVNDTYDRSGTTVTCAPVLEFYCSNMNGNGTIYDMDFDLKDIQVIESDCYVPFIENSFVGNTVHDCSGFCNNGTRTGTLTFSTDCPKYQGSTKLASGNRIVSTSGMVNTSNPTFTCNLWVKMPSATYTTWADIITFPGSATIRMETSNTSGTSLSWYNYPIGTSSGIGTNGAVNNTDWNMFTLTCDGSNWKTYKNAVLVNTVAISGTAWTPNGIISIGDSGMYAQLSDIRIYATALTQTDIKSLYNNAAYIDSSGNVYGAVHSEV